MTNKSTQAFLGRLCAAVPAGVSAAGVGADSCVLSTKAVVEICRARGLRVEPLPVKLRALSPGLSRRLEGEEAQGPEWEVAIGHEPAGLSGWDGHLVALVKGRWLVDTAIRQVNRPAKGIVVEPVVTEVTPDFLEGGPLTLRADNGTTLIYERDPDNRDFLRAPAWTQYRLAEHGDNFSLRRLRAQPGTAPAIQLGVHA